MIGAVVNGEATARTFAARGRAPLVWDLDEARAHAVADCVGGRVATREDALTADLVATVTPAREVLLPGGLLRPGQHVSLMGADGPARRRSRSRSSHAHASSATTGTSIARRELAAAVEAGVLTRSGVTEIGHVLVGDAQGRRGNDDVTVFDSTGLAL